jgi:hypothetical protein
MMDCVFALEARAFFQFCDVAELVIIRKMI